MVLHHRGHDSHKDQDPSETEVVDHGHSSRSPQDSECEVIPVDEVAHEMHGSSVHHDRILLDSPSVSFMGLKLL